MIKLSIVYVQIAAVYWYFILIAYSNIFDALICCSYEMFTAEVNFFIKRLCLQL